MSWPKKIRHISSNKEYTFNQDCLPPNIAWYIGEDDVLLTKISQEDLNSGYYLGWDEDYDWDVKKTNKPIIKTDEVKTNPCRYGHTWKQYVGFSEKYEYCIHCDIKKEKHD